MRLSVHFARVRLNMNGVAAILFFNLRALAYREEGDRSRSGFTIHRPFDRARPSILNITHHTLQGEPAACAAGVFRRGRLTPAAAARFTASAGSDLWAGEGSGRVLDRRWKTGC